MSGDDKIKSNRDAKRLTRIRSAAAWRDASLPTETEQAQTEQKAAEKITCVGHGLNVTMPRELERWTRNQAEDAGISISAWIRRLIEREKIRSEKR